MKKSVLFSVLSALAFVVVLQSCSNDEEMNQEFIADDSTFANFMSWKLEKTNVGPDPALGGAHAGNDETVTRMIYFKDGQKASNGVYPVGTIIVKHSKNPAGTVNEFTAMVKRGNGFNPDGGDWEWFMLNANGSIATEAATGMKMRGATLMNGMCMGCHQSASTDFAFSK